MERTYRKTLTLGLAAILSVYFGLVPAFAASPRDSRGTQLGVDPGRPMVAVCTDSQPCQFAGLVDPGGSLEGAFILDSGYFSVCSAGTCVTPAPFAVTPGFLGGTAVAGLPGGLSPVAIGAIVAVPAGAVGGAVGGTLSTSSGEVQSGSQ